MKRIAAICLALVLSACSVGAQEPTPMPPTATPIPLSSIELRPYLYQEGDLPANLEPGQIRDFAPEMFDRMPKADKEIYMQFSSGGDSAGGVSVFLYEDQNKREGAYSFIVGGMGDSASPVAGIGEKAIGLSMSLGGLDIAEVVLQKCALVIHVRMTRTTNLDDATSYAQQLEKRLSPVVCR